MNDPEYVAIRHAARVIGVPGRTLRRWVKAGTLPVVAGQRKPVVRLADVRRLAARTGHQPDTADGTGTTADQATGHMAEGAADDDMPPSPGSLSPAARSPLGAIRDEWLQPLIDQLREAERMIGRLEAERDQVAQERDALRSELSAMAETPQERDPAAVPDVAGARAAERPHRALRGQPGDVCGGA
jgi:hypothetical protein